MVIVVRVRIEQTSLPGVGVRHDLLTESGRRIAVVAHRTGQRDLVLYTEDDPDAAIAEIPLTTDEATALADLLGNPVVLGQLASLQERVPGLMSAQIAISADSPYVGRTLGDTRARTRTGVSIVAVIRDQEVYPSPDPGFRLEVGDVLVAIGTQRGIDGIIAILARDDTDV